MALTLRLSEEHNEEIEKLKNDIGIKSASAVMTHCTMKYRAMGETIKKQETEIGKLKWELSDIKKIVSEKNEADQKYKGLCLKIEKEY